MASSTGMADGSTATKIKHFCNGNTDFAAPMQAIDENGKGDVYNDVLFQQGYKVLEEESGMKGIPTTCRGVGYDTRRIARFLQDTENQD